MPVEHSIWKIGEIPKRLADDKLDDEDQLEELIFRDINILNDQWLLIGRQVRTDYNKEIDLLTKTKWFSSAA